MSDRRPPRKPPAGRAPNSGVGRSTAPPRALVPILPQTSVEGIVEAVRRCNSTSVELLVPNGTRALQNEAGCQALQQAVARAGIRVTLFTGDPETAAAAERVGLDIIAVGAAVLAPAVPPRAGSATAPQALPPTAPAPGPGAPLPPRDLKPDRSVATDAASDGRPSGAQARQASAAPASSGTVRPPAGAAGTAQPDRAVQSGSVGRPAERTRSGQNGLRLPRREDAPAVRPRENHALPHATDQAFLAGLEAFEQSAQTPSNDTGRVLNSDDGAVLFDVPGDAGVLRAPSDDAAWEAAFGAVDTTMATEPRVTPKRPPIGIDPAPPSPSRLRRFGKRLTPRRTPPPATPGRARGLPAPVTAAPPARRGVGALGLLLAALIGIVVLGGGYALARRYGVTLGAPRLILAPPPEDNQTHDYSTAVLLSSEPLTATNPTSIQALSLSTTAVVSVSGNAEKKATLPVHFASGTLFFRNHLTQRIDIPAGKQFDANGVTFAFDRAVSIPAATSNADAIVFGKADVTVTALTPGAAGNLEAGTIKQLPWIGNGVAVDNARFTGGDSQAVTVVRSEDVNRVLPAAVSQLYANGLSQLGQKAAAQPNLTLTARTITPTADLLKQLQGFRMTVLPPIGAVTSDGTFSVELQGVFSGLALNQSRSSVEDQLAQVIHNQLVTRDKADPRTAVTVHDWSIANGVIQVVASVETPAQPPHFPDGFLLEVQQQIANRPRPEAEQYLQGLVDEHKLATMPALPPEWQTVPRNVQIVAAQP